MSVIRSLRSNCSGPLKKTYKKSNFWYLTFKAGFPNLKNWCNTIFLSSFFVMILFFSLFITDVFPIRHRCYFDFFIHRLISSHFIFDSYWVFFSFFTEKTTFLVDPVLFKLLHLLTVYYLFKSLKQKLYKNVSVSMVLKYNL